MFEGSSYLAFIFHEKEKRDKQGLDHKLGHSIKARFSNKKNALSKPSDLNLLSHGHDTISTEPQKREKSENRN